VSNSFNWIPAVVSLVQNTAVSLAGKASAVVGSHYTAEAIIATTGSRSVLTNRFPARLNRFPSRYVRTFSDIPGEIHHIRLSKIRVQADSLGGLNRAVDDILDELATTLPLSARTRFRGFGGSVREYNVWGEVDDVVKGKVFRQSVGHLLTFGIEFGFQFAEDRQNPYLTTGQVWGRSLVSGGAGTFFAGIFAVGGTAICNLPCGVVGGVAGGTVWSQWIKPIVFQAIPSLQPADRKLQPLNIP
jgi:hypothetical protein